MCSMSNMLFQALLFRHVRTGIESVNHVPFWLTLPQVDTKHVHPVLSSTADIVSQPSSQEDCLYSVCLSLL